MEEDVLFVNPPWFKGTREGIRAGSRWSYTVEKISEDDTIPFPFFLAYAVSLLNQNGLQARLIDGVALRMSLEQFFQELNNYQPRVIIYETSTPSYSYDKGILKRIKEQFSCSKLVFCGPHASIFPEQTLMENPYLDYVFIGEYEHTALEVVQKVLKDEELVNTLGLAYRANGKIVVNERRPLIKDLDNLSYPSRSLLSIYRYNDWFCKFRPNVQMQTSRGCVYHCPFCLWPKTMYGGANYRKRAAKGVVAEMEFLINNYGFKEIYFDDDTFNISQKHVEDICREINRRNLKVIWSAMCNTANMTKQLLEEMKNAGCEGIKLGVETGNAEILDSIGKGTTITQVKKVFEWCKELGLRTHGTFMFGLPGETKRTIQQTIDLLLDLNPDSMQVSITVPFPGTPLYEDAKRKGLLITEDWADFDGTNCVVMRPETLTEEDLKEAYHRAIRLWEKKRFRKNIRGKKFISLKRAICNPNKAIKKIWEMISSSE